MKISFKQMLASLNRMAAAVVACTIAGLLTCAVLANPVIDNVAAGNVSVQQSPGTTVVNQSSQKAIINWQSFNIGHGESTHFNQPAGGVALNRINAAQGASQIYGSLTATGQIILMNAAGVYFGPSAYVNVGGLVATTANISDQNFMNGLYQFSKVGGYSGAIVNEGQIIAAQHGLVALVAPGVVNKGMIQANLGKVILASGEAFTLNFSGDSLVNFAVTAKTASPGLDKDGNPLPAGISNTGSIFANGGTIILSAQAVAGILDHMINMEGIAQTQSVYEENGQIILSSDPDSGIVRVAANLDASGKGAGETGGNITITGHHILIDSPSSIDVSGDTGGGDVFIGGNYQGKGPLPNANATVMAPNAIILADAITAGNGGNVILWADNVTKFYGEISAKGGSVSGNGGFVETSGRAYLDALGIVTTSATNGLSGNWLLDPANITISTGANANYTNLSNTFTPDSGAATSTINTTTLSSALASNNIIITTTNTGTDGGSAGNITVSNPISWASGNSLTLTAANTIAINAAITIGNSAAAQLILNAVGNVTQSAAIGGSGGLTIQGPGTTILSQANTYSGTTTINAGTLSLTSIGALGNTTGTTIASGATLDIGLTSATLTNTNTISVSGTGNGGIGAITSTGTNNILTNNITMTGDTTLGGTAGTTRLNGSVTGGFAITKVGTSEISLGGSNTLGGTTLVSNGILDLNNNNALNGSTAVIVSNGASLQLSGATIPSIPITLSGVGSASKGALTSAGGTNATWNGDITVSGVATTFQTQVTNTTLILNGTITGSPAITFNGLGSITANGIISTGGGITSAVTGNGVVTLSNNSNSYSGATTISSGTMTLPQTGALGNTSSTTVASGAVLNLTFSSGTLSNTNALSLSGTGISSAGALTFTGTNVVLNNAITLGAATTIGGTGSGTLNGDISGAFGLTKAGAGTITLNGNNSAGYTTTTVNAGILRLGSVNALGSSTTNVAVAGAALDISFSNGTLSNTSAITLRGTGVSSAGAMTFTGSNATLSNPITLATATTIGGTGSGALNGDISGAFALTKAGSGTITLGGNNGSGYTTTTISLGTLSLGSTTALGSSTTNVSVAGATLDIGFSNGTLSNTNAITIRGTGVGAAGALTFTGTSATLSNPIALATAATIGGTGSGTINGNITGAFALTKAGSSTLTFGMGAGNTFTTTTVSGGTLSLNTINGLGSSTTSISSGATLNIGFSNGTLANTSAITVTGTGVGGTGALFFSGSTDVLSNPITVGASGMIGGSGSAISMNGAFNGAQSLTISGLGSISLGSTVGATTALTGLTVNAPITLNGNVTTTGAQTYNNPVTIANTLTIASGAGTITMPAVSLGANTLSINSTSVSGAITGNITGSGGLTKLGTGTLTLSGNNSYTGTTTISTGILSLGNTQAFGTTSGVDGTGSVAITSGATLGFGFTGTLANTLTIPIVGTGSGAGGVLIFTGSNSVVSNNFTMTGASTIGGSGTGSLSGNITGGQILTKTGAGSIILSGSNTLSGATAINNGILALGSTTALSGSTSVSVTSTGSLQLNNISYPSLALTLNGTGSGAGGGLIGTGTSTWNGNITLAGTTSNIGATAISDSLTIAGTLNGTAASTQSLGLVGSGSIIFSNAISSTTRLLTITSAAATTTVLNGGSVNLSGSGNMTFSGPVVLGANTTFSNTTAGRPITFGNTVNSDTNGPWTFTLSNTTGTATFTGAIGGIQPLASLTTGTGAITINTDSIITTGNQAYNGAVTLATTNPKTFTSSAGSISFAGTLNGGLDLTLNGNTGITFTGIVGGTTPLASLTVTGATAVNGASITTSGNQTYNSNVTPGAATTTLTSTGTSGNITFNSPISWATTNTLALVASGTSGTLTLPTTITAATGGLALTASNNVGSINASSTNIASLANFNLITGQWVQVAASLPTFNVTNFRTNSGSGFNANTKFVRALSGDGSSGTPYQITDVYGLQGIGSGTETLGFNYLLANNINASSTSTWNTNAGWVAIGSSGTQYSGIFNGQNYTISGLVINRSGTTNLGLFAYSSGTLQNFTLSGGSITIGNVGGAILANNNGIVDYVISNTTLSNGNTRGGIVGLNNGTISNSTNLSSISESNFAVGGIAGRNSATGIITDSYNAGAITAVAANGSNVGGIVGTNNAGGQVINSYNTGTITGFVSTNDTHSVGGIVGFNQGSITDSYNSGSLLDVSYQTGGIVGYNNGGTVNNSYSTGYMRNPSALSDQGGAVGLTDAGGSVTNTYWNTQTSNFSTSPGGGTGLTTAQMMQQSNFNTWDFSTVWNIIPGQSYPYLRTFYTSTPRVISGTSAASGGATVQLAANASTITTVTTGANGFYYFLLANGTVADNSAILTYLSGNSTKGNAITVAPTSGGSITGLSMTANNVIGIGDDSISSFSNTDLANARGSLSSTDILYSFSGNNLTLGNATNRTGILTSTTNTTYTVNGTISAISGGTSGVTYNGPVIINNDITTTGNQIYNGSLTPGAATTTLTSTGASGTITLNQPITWSNSNTLALVASGSSGTLNLNNSITAANGTLNLTASNTSNSIATTASSAISVDTFNLITGQWIQVSSTLPAFNVTSNFMLNSGTLPNTATRFIRATGGSGTTLNPYTITDVYGLQGIGSNVTTLGYSYNLANNIDMSGTSSWNSGLGFVPIGSSINYFTGSLNGQNFTLSNLYINRSTPFVGLFAVTSVGSTIQNLGLTNINITHTGVYTGGLVSIANGTITNSYVTGDIDSQQQYAGGMVGLNSGAISNSYSQVNISGNAAWIASLVGYNDTTGSITSSYATGTVISSSDAGGLVGANLGSISKSYSTGAVSNHTGGYYHFGGLVGYNSPTAVISDSYSTGSVNTFNTSSVGGLVGRNDGAVTNSYATGQVVALAAGLSYGGLIGQTIGGTITNSYWDTDTSGTSFSGGGGTGLTTAQMKTQSSFSGWDFSTTWNIIPNYTYPYLIGITRGISGSAGVNGATVTLASNGAILGSAISDGTGFYYLLVNNIANGSSVLAYLDNNATIANAVALAPSGGSTLSGLSLTANTLTLGNTNSATITPANLLSAKGSLSDTDILFSVSGNTITLGSGTHPNVNLATTATTTYALSNAITQTGSGNFTFAGPTTINLANFTTNGAQTFSGTTTLGTTTVLDAGSNTITLGAINGAFGLTTTSSTGVTFNGAVGSTITNLVVNAPAVINANITTTGNQTYNGAITPGAATTTLTTTGTSGNITITQPLTWATSNTLALAASGTSGTLTLPSTITAASGGLTLTASNTSGSINASSVAINSLANFNLITGQWVQVNASLPTFNVTNFRTNSGNGSSANIRFIRALGGDGSSGNPYQITDLAGLQAIGSGTTTLAFDYILANNIDASATTSWNSGSGFVPISIYTGSFDGSNNTISNLYINRSATTNVGLFGRFQGPIIKNLVLSNVNITGGTSTAGLVGFGLSSIDNVYVSGSVTGTTQVGMLVGNYNAAASTISNSHSTGTVSGTSVVGGLVGIHQLNVSVSSITDSYSTANVSGTTDVGGLVGAMQNNNSTLTISNSYATGNVTGTTGVGGLLGRMQGNTPNANFNIIDNSYSTSHVTGTTNVGGLVGYSLTQSGGSGTNTISNSYSAGSITTTGAGSAIGGFIGNAGSTTIINNNSYSNIASISNINGADNIGGFVGTNAGTITGAHSVANITIANGSLRTGGFAGVNSGTITSSYATGSITNNTTTAGLSGDIGGLVGSNSGTISQSYSTGNILASGYSNSVGGLVGDNTSTGSITTSYSTGSVSALTSFAIGGLTGQNTGNISTSYATGSVTAGNAPSSGSDSSAVGGLIGYMTAGTVNQTYSSGPVTSQGGHNFGGLVGRIDGGTVSNSYNSGTVASSTSTLPNFNIGGAIGLANGGAITNIYSIGLISTDAGASSVGGLVGNNVGLTTTNSYWNTETSGQGSSAAGTGLTTTQMKLQASFTGWDFATVWNMVEGSTYPYLRAFYTTVRAISGSTPTTAGTQIAIANNGSVISTIYSGANGDYYFLAGSNIADGDSILAYINSGSLVGNAVTVAPGGGGNITGFNILANGLNVGSDNIASVSNSTLSTAVGSLSGSAILYSASGNDITLGNSTYKNIAFNTTANTTYNVNGNINSTSGTTSSSITFNAAPTVNTTATLSAVTISFINGLTGNGNITITGANSSNTFSMKSTSSQIFNITGSNSGNASSIGNFIGTIAFNNIQNIVGGDNGNTFNFSNNATMTGTINGSNLNSINTINLNAYNAAIKVILSSTNDGVVRTMSDNLITAFANITHVNPNASFGNTIYTPSGKGNNVYITGGRAGYINDPIYFTGVNSLIASSGGSVNFLANATFDAITGLYTVDGVTMSLNGFNSISGYTTTTSIDVSNIIQQPPTNAEQNVVSTNTSTSSWVLAGTSIDQNLTTMVTDINNEMDNDLQKVKINPYCYTTQ